MRISGCWVRRQIAGGLVMFLAIPFAQAAAPLQEQQTQNIPAHQEQAAKALPPENEVADRYPDSPQPQQAQPAETSAPTQQQAVPPPQSPTEPQSSGSGKPVGTAAAPLERTTGVAASRPAGAVIAPGKQRRARSILIRVSIVVGAAVAIGTVAGLSEASSSKPH
jgi:hypothetical protein